MQITKTVEYAMRVMAHLALSYDQKPLRTKDIHRQTNIPEFYCSKILRSLVTAKLLKAEKGHGGGFVLSKRPQQIKFIQIFEAVEGTLDAKKCIFGLNKCSHAAPCPLHQRWCELNDNFQRWARETSLADIQNDMKNMNCRV